MALSESNRRRFPRAKMPCPIRLTGPGGAVVAIGQTVDISDGGTLIAVEPQVAPIVGSVVDVSMEVPSGPMGSWPMRVFTSRAKVLRHRSLDEDPGKTGVAMEFVKPLKLNLKI